MQAIYQGALFPPDASGVAGCALFGMPAHGIGDTPEEALRSIAEILQSGIDAIAAVGGSVPAPADPPAEELARGRPVAVVAIIPDLAVA